MCVRVPCALEGERRVKPAVEHSSKFIALSFVQ